MSPRLLHPRYQLIYCRASSEKPLVQMTGDLSAGDIEAFRSKTSQLPQAIIIL
jgi:hypothetical protein